MNLQQIMRVVVCAALVALGIAGAGVLPTQPVAGQETGPVTLQGAAALDQLKQKGQYESLQAAMNQARFSVSRAEQTPLGRAAWRAPNPAAGYDAYVTEAGVSIIVKGAVNDQSYVSLSLHSLGYGAAMRAVAPGKVSGDKQTINITREGGVREWFVNGADGLEHGFTLANPPGARQAGFPLRLALQVGAGWRAIARDDGQQVTLRSIGGQAVEYGKLVVRDKLGRNIPARMTVAEEQVVIAVEDGDAAYPLTVDPLFTLQQKLTAADGAANDLLGFKVALSGNTALVGAPYADQTRGAAYVFVRNGATWTQQARLNANDGAEQDYFGWSVALKGDLALVGAIYGPGSLNPEQGAVYVFVRSGTTWSQQAKLSANENTQGAQFGEAVALDGDTALVGAPAYTITPSFAVPGAVFIFVRNGATWTQQARLLANDGEDGDSFGVTVALEGDTALVGAPNNEVTAGGQGAAYVFTRSGTSWTQQQRLIAVNAAADDHFGNAVALGGNKALIGAYLQGSDDRGAVYDFRRGATGWTQTNRFFAPNPTAGAQFGVSLALSGDTAVVGSSLGLFQPGADQRSAYVFVNGGEWLPVRQFGPELGTADDRFGYAVALDGDTVLVGAYRGDADANDQGAAYAFVLHDSQHVEQQKLTANDGGTFDQFGNAVALDGDTLAVGAQWDDVGMNGNQGSVYIFARNGTVWTFQQKLTAIDGAAEDWFGNAVALSGNTVAVGAFRTKIGANSLQGAIYVFTRSGVTWTQQQKLIANDGAASNLFGQAVALSGNTVAVGAYQAKIGTNGLQGSAYVFTRSGTTWTFQQKLTANDGAVGDQFGWSVALNGDTVAVGAFGDTIGANSQQGSAYVFVRNGTAWAQQQKLTANDGAAQDRFGSAVALSGDTVVVGANQHKIGTNVNQGSAYVFARSGTAWTQQQKLTAADGGADDRFGTAVALGGDTLVVGTLSNSLGLNSNPGSAYVFTRLGNWVQQKKLAASDGASQDFFGGAVALSGDTVVVGAPGDKIGNNEDQGSAYVFVSPPCPAITLAPGGLPDGVPGVAYDQPVTESGGGVGEYVLSVSRGALPPGLTLGSVPGRLYGTPATPGTYRFTITTTHLLSLCTGSREYTITILPCPAITVGPAALSIGVRGAAYSQSVTASADGSGTAAYSFAVTEGVLPPGLGLNTNGMLSGTPSQAGSYNFTVTASLTTTTCTGTRAYTLTILPTCPTLTVAPPMLPNGAVGTPYSHGVTVTGGAEPYLIGLNLGSNLPPGMSFVNGVLAGTPTQAGMYSFLARIRDANGCQGSQGYTVTINPPCPPITINPATLPNGAPGAAYSQTLTVSVSTLAASFAVTAGALPPGLSLSASGVLSGTPTQAGSYNFTVTASANGCMGERAYTLTINSPPAISAAAVSYQAGSSAASKVIATVSDANQPAATLTVTVNGSASATVSGITLSSLSINAAGAVSASVVAACGAANAAFTLTVTDNASVAANATLNVTVTANSPPALNYAVQSVAAGAGLAINPASGPSDNGAIASIAVQSPGTFTGTLAVNPTTGVVTLSNAKPGGTHNITIRATDNCGATQDALLRLDVTCPAITLNPPALPGGNVGVNYNQTLTANGGTPGYSFSANPSELPDGLTLSANGTLSGTPTSGYGGGFTVTATDANGCRGTRFYSFTVNAPPTITALNGSARQGSPASQQVIANVQDNQFTDTLSYTINGGASATVNGVTVSNLSATRFNVLRADVIAACTAANASFTLTVTDDFGVTASATLNINATTNSVPVLSYANQSLALGGALTINPASGPSDNGSVASIAVQSQGTFTGSLSVNNTTGVINVSNAQPAGSHTVTIRATDNCGTTRDVTFTLSVNCPAITLDPAPPGGVLPGGTTGVSYQQTITATGGVAPHQFSVSAGALPVGLSLSTGGALTGTPGAGGTFNFTVKATDTNGCTGTRAYSLTVACPSITINPATLPNGTTGVAYSQTLTGMGGSAPYSFTLDGGALPSGVALASTGTLTGTPGASGVSNFTVKATDMNGCAGTRAYALTVVCPSIAINPATLPNGTIGVVYSQTLTGTGGTAPYSFALDGGALPSGVTLAANGALTGTPSANGAFNFTVKATDANGCAGTRAYTLTVICPSITVNPAPPGGMLPGGTAGMAYNQVFTATGGAAPYSYALTSGALPNGITLSNAGALSGTPVVSGNFNFTVTVTDANGCTGQRAYALAINGNCPTITVNPATLPNGTVGIAYNQTATATGGIAPYSYTINAGSLPAGINLASGGGLTGMPNAAGVFNFTIKATDANGCFGSRAYTVTINGNGGGNNGLQFYPLERPVRILDTRAGQGNCDNISAPINGGSSLTTFARLTCEGISIPANAQAVVGNVTVINQTNQTGYMTVYPDGQAAPLAANMIYEPGGILANNFTVGLSASGNFNIFGERTIDAIVDISGYYAPPTAGGLYYHPLSKPVRLLDTRPGQGNCDNAGAPIAAGTSLTKLARMTCEGLTIPQAAQAIVGNATVINGSGQVGYLTIYPNGVPAPLAANIVYFPGQILANAFTVSLSAGGELNIFAERTIDMVIDVAGYYSSEANDANGAGLLFTPLATPVRLLDTRAGQGNCDSVNAPIASGTSLTKLARMTCEGQIIPNNAQAVIGNVTVINQMNLGGYLTLYPTGQAAPLAANMIYQPSQILSNAFVVGLSASGQFNIFAERTLDAIVDVSGFFAP